MKRDAVKYIRDKAKSAYQKSSSCAICATTSTLELHHYKSVARMLDAWLRKHNYKEDEVLTYRDAFILDNYENMYNNTVTLCKVHHKKLHTIYGVEPLLSTGEKQRRWVEIQRGKHV